MFAHNIPILKEQAVRIDQSCVHTHFPSVQAQLGRKQRTEEHDPYPGVLHCFRGEWLPQLLSSE